jgi:gliding motility-associated-like protein
MYTAITANCSPFLTSTSPKSISLTSPTDLDSLTLVSRYRQYYGIKWTGKANWPTVNLVTWQGVRFENGRVVILNLGDQTASLNLAGPLHTELSNLTLLRLINLNNNQLTGLTRLSPQILSSTQSTLKLAASRPVEVVVTVTNNDLSPCEKDPIVDLYLDFTATPTTLDSRHSLLTCAIPYGLNLTYEWDMGDGSIDHGIVVQHNYNISNIIMNYTVKVTVSNPSGCVRTASKVIDAIPFIPNVFSPNGDGINDIFMPDVDLQIFDRNGTIYYKGNAGWDGTYKGRKAEQDTYFYLIEFTDGNHKVTSRKGFITLVK